MSSTIPFSLIFPTHLLDVLDDAWLGETLPDDGEGVKRDRERLARPEKARVERILFNLLLFSLPRNPAARRHRRAVGGPGRPTRRRTRAAARAPVGRAGAGGAAVGEEGGRVAVRAPAWGRGASCVPGKMRSEHALLDSPSFSVLSHARPCKPPGVLLVGCVYLCVCVLCVCVEKPPDLRGAPTPTSLPSSPELRTNAQATPTTATRAQHTHTGSGAWRAEPPISLSLPPLHLHPSHSLPLLHRRPASHPAKSASGFPPG